MSRQYQPFGESLINVRFGNHADLGLQGTSSVSNSGNPLYELGLATDKIDLSLNLRSNEIKYVEWGSEIPAEIMGNVKDAIVSFTLIHYDRSVLDYCIGEAQGGVTYLAPGNPIGLYTDPGSNVIPGALLGNNCAFQASGNHFVTLNILSTDATYPWRFLTCYLMNPLQLPLSVRASETRCQFRAIPYQNYITKLADGSDPVPGQPYTPGQLVTSDLFYASGGVWDHNTEY